MLEDFEAARDVELAWTVRDFEDTGRDEVARRIQLLREGNGRGVEVESSQFDIRHALGDEVSHKALTAAGVEERGRLELRDLLQMDAVKTIDELSLDRVAVRVLDVVAGVQGVLMDRGSHVPSCSTLGTFLTDNHKRKMR